MSKMLPAEIVNQSRLYFDYAASTPLDPRVVQVMSEVGRIIYGNASSLHEEGRIAREYVEKYRGETADLMSADGHEVYFCSGGSEADNWAILGVARANMNRGKHIIISAIEHKAVYYPVMYLQKEGFEIEICPVDNEGLLNLEKLKKMVRKDTILVSAIYANNEIGTVQDIKEICKIIKGINANCYIHTDACQATNYLDIDVRELGIDLMSISGNKIYGPKSSGILYIRKGVKIDPLIFGGGQEFGMRAGTEDVVKIAGLVEALRNTRRIVGAENKRLYELREKIFSTILNNIDNIYINGSRKSRLVNNINISIAGAEGESLVLYLDHEGFAVSTGSACSASDLKPSGVLLALGLPVELAHCSLRISLGRYTSEEGVNRLLSVLPKVIEKVRKMSAIKK